MEKKERILIITKDYFPTESAITNCINSYIDILKEKYELDILTCNNDKESDSFQRHDDISIYRTKDILQSYLKNVKKGKNKFLMFFTKINWIFYYRFIRPFKICNDSNWNIGQALTLGKKLMRKNNYRVILSISYPFDSHIIASKLKRKNTVWCAIQFDPYTYNYTYEEKYTRIRMKKEIKIFSRCNAIFVPLLDYRKNDVTKNKKISSKYINIDYPLIKEKAFMVNTKDNGSQVIFSYAGMLYSKIRSPEPVLNFFYNCSRQCKTDFKLVFYYIGDNEIDMIFEKYKKLLRENLVVKKNASKKECDELLYKSNFIINIENNVENQTPSKIFEYISSGKPIINFFNFDKDICKFLLSDYKLKINIKIDLEYKNFDFSNIEAFIYENKEKTLTFSEATAGFIDSKEATRKFFKLLFDVINNNL